MKKNTWSIGAILIATTMLSFTNFNQHQISKYNKQTHYLNSAGSPGGKTGAPGDATCTQCHSGAVQNGSGFNTITISQGGSPVTQYETGETYDITVSMATNNPKNGFEIVPLSPTNTMAGSITITDNTNTKSISSGGKTRVTHTSAGNALTSWSFQWTAPATNIGNVTFYLATNQTNSSSSDAGDVIRTSQLSIGSVSSLVEKEIKLQSTATYIKTTNTVSLDFSSLYAGEGFFNLVDSQGKSVFVEKLGQISAGESSLSVLLGNRFETGIYFVHLSIGNTIVTNRILITN